MKVKENKAWRQRSEQTFSMGPNFTGDEYLFEEKYLLNFYQNA